MVDELGVQAPFIILYKNGLPVISVIRAYIDQPGQPKVGQILNPGEMMPRKYFDEAGLTPSEKDRSKAQPESRATQAIVCANPASSIVIKKRLGDDERLPILSG